MKLFWVIATILAQQDFLTLDEFPKGYTLRNSEICNKDKCYPLYFTPTQEFQVVRPGQRIPKGLHVTMDFTTKVKQAKLMSDASNQESETSVSVVDTPNDSPESFPDPIKKPAEKEPVIIPNETKEKSSITMEEVKTIDILFQKMNSTNSTDIVQVLEVLSDAVHQIDIGAGLTVSEPHVESLLSLMHHEDVQVCSQAALVLGSAVSNNPMAQKNVVQVDGILEKLVKRFAGLPDGLCRTRIMFLLTSLTRTDPDIFGRFLVFDPLNLFLEKATDEKMKLRLYRYANDIAGLLQEHDLDVIKWCNALRTVEGSKELKQEARQLLDKLSRFPKCEPNHQVF